jgi:hypothetical protein
MANKRDGLLVSLGKRLLGFNTSAPGCCAGPAAADTKKPEAVAPVTKPILVTVPDTTAGSCCAPTCCSADAPVDSARS